MRIEWGTPGDKVFETGIDRGVLYVDLQASAWNGITSIEEGFAGGDVKTFYHDGVRHLAVVTGTDFEATLKAFASPKAFGACDGSSDMGNGLIITQQPRRQFGLSYRTLVGDDIKGAEAGYKLHLVYNCLAEPSSRSYETLSDNVEADEKSWTIHTVPLSITNQKPTAHIVIDSTKTRSGLLRTIENILYGTAISSPRLPEPQEVFDMFASEGPVLATNLIEDPAMRSNPAFTEFRRNMLSNPTFAVSGTKWTYYVGVSGTATSGRDAGAGVSGDGFGRITWSVSPISSGGFATEIVSVVAGEKYTYSAYVRSSVAMNVRPQYQFYNNGTPTTGSSMPANVAIPANVWTRVSWELTIPTGSNQVQWRIYIDGAPLVPGSTMDLDDALMEKGINLLPYFDGNTVDTMDEEFSWTGAVNDSPSVQKMRSFGSAWLQPSPADDWYYKVHEDGIPALKVFTTVGGTNLRIYRNWYAFSPGESAATFLCDVKVLRPMRIRQTFNPQSSTGVSLEASRTDYDLTPEDGWVTLRHAATLPAETGRLYAQLWLYAYGSTSSQLLRGETLLTRNWRLSKGIDELPYFDGSTPDEDGDYFSWVGTPDNSASEMRSWNY